MLSSCIPRKWLLSGALAMLLAAPVGAQVTITDGNVPGNPEENVLFQDVNNIGNPIFGVTNQTNQGVKFESETTGEVLIGSTASGQAVLTAQDGAFSQVCISLASLPLPSPANIATVFTWLEFTVTDATTSGTLAFTAYVTGDGTVTKTLPYNQTGNNRYNIFTDGTVTLDKVCFTANPELLKALQFRIGGLRGPNGPLVPEAGSIPMLAGGLAPVLGLIWRRRRS